MKKEYENDRDLRETTQSSKLMFDGDLLKLYKDKILLPDGTSSVREWVTHQGASAVLPIFENGDTLLLRQFRYPFKKVFWEVPAGKIDPGESADTTAARELEEEAGLQFKQSAYLGRFCPSIGYTDEVIYLYMAWELSDVGHRVDDDEFLIRHRLPLEEAIEMVYKDEITDGKTITTLLKTWFWLKKHQPNWFPFK